MDLVISVLRLIVLLVALVIWAVIGFAFWIPLLARQIVTFSALILYVTLTNQDPDSVGRGLDLAVTFYPSGFRKILTAIVGNSDRAWSGPGIDFRVAPFLAELTWTLVFWLVTLAAIGQLGNVRLL